MDVQEETRAGASLTGILVAGGSGSRLLPMTRVTSKHLLPVFDKPMVYYPLSTLMLAGARSVVVIVAPQHLDAYRSLLGDGSWIGMDIRFAVQRNPSGIGHAVRIAVDSYSSESYIVALGDNVFAGPGLGRHLRSCVTTQGAQVLGHEVSFPEQYAVADLDSSGEVLGLTEKPRNPASNIAVPGLYFYDGTVGERVKALRPSQRGELEITDLNIDYLRDGQLAISQLPRGSFWFDAGTPENLQGASDFVRVTQERHRSYLGCIEEVAWRNDWISKDMLLSLAESHSGSAYGAYLSSLIPRSKEAR